MERLSVFASGGFDASHSVKGCELRSPFVLDSVFDVVGGVCEIVGGTGIPGGR
jgi:hypothetical protein